MLHQSLWHVSEIQLHKEWRMYCINGVRCTNVYGSMYVTKHTSTQPPCSKITLRFNQAESDSITCKAIVFQTTMTTVAQTNFEETIYHCIQEYTVL